MLSVPTAALDQVTLAVPSLSVATASGHSEAALGPVTLPNCTHRPASGPPRLSVTVAVIVWLVPTTDEVLSGAKVSECGWFWVWGQVAAAAGPAGSSTAAKAIGWSSSRTRRSRASGREVTGLAGTASPYAPPFTRAPDFVISTANRRANEGHRRSSRVMGGKGGDEG